jgi:hypothetical protein
LRQIKAARPRLTRLEREGQLAGLGGVGQILFEQHGLACQRGGNATNPSRKVPRQDGSSPTTGRPREPWAVDFAQS